MITERSAMLPFLPKTKRLFLAATGAALLAVTLSAQPATERIYSPSDETSEMLGKYRVVADAKKYDEAIALIDAQLLKTAPGSYDLALLYQIKAQTYLQKGDYSKAIEPMERGLKLSDAQTPNFFGENEVRNLNFFLAQLYYQEATQTKDPKAIAAYFDLSEKYLIRWAAMTKKPTIDNQMFYAQVLYTRAVQNPDHPDLEKIKQALDQVEKGLRMVTRPKDSVFVLKFVCLQQLNRYEEAAEVLELLLRQKPDSATYWQQLAALYLSTAQDVRAILTIERAQALGHLNTPKDNYNLIGIYFNIGQYEKAAELLEKGLKNGGIENDSKNWELLAFSYQQLERPLKGIEALKQASIRFPKNGQLEFMIAQAYQAIELPDDALPHAQAAIAKGGLSKPHSVYLFLSYVAYELKKFDIALEAAKKAGSYPEAAKEGANMTHAIEDIIKDREAKKNKM